MCSHPAGFVEAFRFPAVGKTVGGVQTAGLVFAALPEAFSFAASVCRQPQTLDPKSCAGRVSRAFNVVS